MTWTFEITETSNGSYACKGVRNTGNVVSLQCTESEFYKVFKLAYDLEVKLGTLPSKALFLVVSGSRPDWKSQYHDKVFGSWIVNAPNRNDRFVYDGKDFLLMIYGPGNRPMWQGRVREKEDGEDIIFKFVQNC